MKKTNLTKIIVCTIMFTLMFGTTVFAGTYTNSAKVRGNTYQNTYNGSYGTYVATGGVSAASTLAGNETNEAKMFYCSVSRYNWNINEYDDMAQYADVLAGNTGKIVSISRNQNNDDYDYYHNAQAFSSTSSTTSTRVDNYNFTAKQRY